MKKELFKRILELAGISLNEAFSSYQYKLPSDKEAAMYDFYLATFYYGKKSEIKDDVADFIFKSITSNLFEQIKNDLLIAVEDAIYAESPHILFNLDLEPIYEVFEKHNMGDFFFKYVDGFATPERQKMKEETIYDKMEKYQNAIDKLNTIDTAVSNEERQQIARETGYPAINIIKVMKDLFESGPQVSSIFGGEPWANICGGWLRLNAAKSDSEKIVAIDHVYDLEHNNGTVFEKSERFKKNDSYEWVKEALDFKRDVKNVWELWEKCSPGFKLFMARIIKNFEDSTYEEHKKGDI